MTQATPLSRLAAYASTVGAVCMLALAPVHKAAAQAPSTLPDGVVNFIIPVAVGGGTDMTFRALAEAARPHLNRNVVVFNITGAGGAIGLTQAAQKPGNGLNINSYTSEIFTLGKFAPTQFSPKDFWPILLVNEDPACLIVPADSKLDTIEKFIAEAKANPGKVSVGNSGFGNIWHLSASALAKKAGVDLLQIPYTGAAPTVQAALSGTINAFVASPPEVASQVQGGKMKIIAVMADKRSAMFPDVPTLKEKGIDLSIGTWRAIGAPASTSDAAVKALQDGFAAGMKEKAFVDFMNTRGLTIRYMNTAELTDFVNRERPFYEALAEEVAKTRK